MTVGSPRDLARLARSTYLEGLRQNAGALVAACAEGARMLASQSAEMALFTRRRELVMGWSGHEAAWIEALLAHVHAAHDALFHGAVDHFGKQRGGQGHLGRAVHGHLWHAQHPGADTGQPRVL